MSPRKQARARLFYKYLSKVYDRINPSVWNEGMRAEALETIDIRDVDRVLGVGCGTGFVTGGLLEHTRDVHVYDESETDRMSAAAGSEAVTHRTRGPPIAPRSLSRPLPTFRGTKARGNEKKAGIEREASATQ